MSSSANARQALENYATAANQALTEANALTLQSAFHAAIVTLVKRVTELDENTAMTFEEKQAQFAAIETSYKKLSERKKFIDQKAIPWLKANPSKSSDDLISAFDKSIQAFNTVLTQWMTVLTKEYANSTKTPEPVQKRSWLCGF